MNRFLKDAAIFSIISLIAFGIINVVLAVVSAMFTFDHWQYGFPFTIYEAWGPCPPQATGDCTSSYPLNVALNALIAIGLGTAVAYTKNRQINKATN